MSSFSRGGRVGESAREVCSVSTLSFSSCTGMMLILVVLAEDVVEEVAEAVEEEFEEEFEEELVEDPVEEFVCDRSALGEGVSVSTTIGPLA